MNYSKKTIPELKAICKELKIKGISGKRKQALIDLIKQSESEPKSPSTNKTEHTSKIKRCKQEGHNKRSGKTSTTPVSAPKNEAKTDIKATAPVKVEPEMNSSITREDAEKSATEWLGESPSLNNDISGLANINELYENSIIKKYIKPISLDKTINFETLSQKSYFIHIANIVLDTEINDTGKSKGKKKRNTLIKLDNFNKELIDKKKEWLYIIVINNQIVKIGGTRSGIKERFGSYLCGHHIAERNKSGKASETNKYVYNTLYFYLEQGCEIKLYGFELPVEEITRIVFGNEIKIRVQTYHSYESVLIDDFKKQNGFMPFLCDNSDPDYKE
jgi:hypothetical protein